MPTKRRTRSSVNDNTSLSSKKSKDEPEPEARVDKEREVAEVSCENSMVGSGSGKKVNKGRSSSKKPIDSVKKLPVRGENDADNEPEARFLGDPVPDGEARQRWPKRYEVKVFYSFTFTK